MTATLAIAVGLVLLAAPVSAHRADRQPAHKPAAIAEQPVAPIERDGEPRICLFSVGGKTVEPTPGRTKGDATRQAARKAPGKRATEHQPPQPQANAPGERMCDVDTPPALKSPRG